MRDAFASPLTLVYDRPLPAAPIAPAPAPIWRVGGVWSRRMDLLLAPIASLFPIEAASAPDAAIDLFLVESTYYPASCEDAFFQSSPEGLARLTARLRGIAAPKVYLYSLDVLHLRNFAAAMQPFETIWVVDPRAVDPIRAAAPLAEVVMVPPLTSARLFDPWRRPTPGPMPEIVIDGWSTVHERPDELAASIGDGDTLDIVDTHYRIHINKRRELPTRLRPAVRGHAGLEEWSWASRYYRAAVLPQGRLAPLSQIIAATDLAAAGVPAFTNDSRIGELAELMQRPCGITSCETLAAAVERARAAHTFGMDDRTAFVARHDIDSVLARLLPQAAARTPAPIAVVDGENASEDTQVTAGRHLAAGGITHSLSMRTHPNYRRLFATRSNFAKTGDMLARAAQAGDAPVLVATLAAVPRLPVALMTRFGRTMHAEGCIALDRAPLPGGQALMSLREVAELAGRDPAAAVIGLAMPARLLDVEGAHVPLADLWHHLEKRHGDRMVNVVTAA